MDRSAARKRGRKPRDKVYSVSDVTIQTGEENTGEHVILHLPVSSQDIVEDNRFDDVHIMEYDPECKEPSPFDPDINAASLLEKSADIAGGRPIVEYRDEKSNVSVKNILFHNSASEQMPIKTGIWCWWCSHPFDDPPVGIPLHDKSHGIFCSYNCAAAHLFTDYDLKDKRWEAYSKLNLEYNKSPSSTKTKVKMAPPRIALQCFGGYMSIEEFRTNNQRNDTTFKLMLPPMTMIVPQVEEKLQSEEYEKSAVIPVNRHKMNLATENLALKRSKPILNDKHTLSSYMSIKKVPKKSAQ